MRQAFPVTILRMMSKWSSFRLYSLYCIYLFFSALVPACSPIFSNSTLCRINFCIPICFFFWTRITKWSASRPFALCDLYGPPCLIRFLRLFPRIITAQLPNFLVTKCVTQWIFKPSSRKYYCLNLTGIIFMPFSTTHSPKVSRTFCNISMSFLFAIFL